MQRTLLLHGPLNSPGVNEVTQYLHQDPATRKAGWADYHAGQNIVAMAHGFRAAGFRIAYSGWVEDSEWLHAHRGLFDSLVLSEQKHIAAECVFRGVLIPNNKEKIYWGALRGLQAIERELGPDGLVLRCRSDVAIDPHIVADEFSKVPAGSRRILVECFNAHKMFSLPDFLIGGELATLKRLYEELHRRCVEGRSYHMSSHVDHSLTCLRLGQTGEAGPMVSMGAAAFQSMVWRGVPRHLASGLQPPAVKRMFDCALELQPGMDIDAIAREAGPDLADRRHLQAQAA